MTKTKNENSDGDDDDDDDDEHMLARKGVTDTSPFREITVGFTLLRSKSIVN